jgi:hypothetical protein
MVARSQPPKCNGSNAMDNENVGTVETPVASPAPAAAPKPRPVPKPAAKAAPVVAGKIKPKAAVAKAAPKAKPTAGTVKVGTEREKDLPWGDKKVAIFKALKQLKAVGATASKPGVEVAAKAGVTPRDVRHYCYHAKAAGLVGVGPGSGFAGYGFYLTAKGAAVDPVAAQKAEQKAKAAG